MVCFSIVPVPLLVKFNVTAVVSIYRANLLLALVQDLALEVLRTLAFDFSNCHVRIQLIGLVVVLDFAVKLAVDGSHNDLAEAIVRDVALDSLPIVEPEHLVSQVVDVESSHAGLYFALEVARVLPAISRAFHEKVGDGRVVARLLQEDLGSIWSNSLIGLAYDGIKRLAKGVSFQKESYVGSDEHLEPLNRIVDRGSVIQIEPVHLVLQGQGLKQSHGLHALDWEADSRQIEVGLVDLHSHLFDDFHARTPELVGLSIVCKRNASLTICQITDEVITKITSFELLGQGNHLSLFFLKAIVVELGLFDGIDIFLG